MTQVSFPKITTNAEIPRRVEKWEKSQTHFCEALVSIALIKLINYHTDCLCSGISLQTVEEKSSLLRNVRLKTRINYSLFPMMLFSRFSQSEG